MYIYIYEDIKNIWTCLRVLQKNILLPTVWDVCFVFLFFPNTDLPLVFFILTHNKPSTENYCFASRAKSCSKCLQSGIGCAYCPDEVRRKMASRSKLRLLLRELLGTFFFNHTIFYLCA